MPRRKKTTTKAAKALGRTGIFKPVGKQLRKSKRPAGSARVGSGRRAPRGTKPKPGQTTHPPAKFGTSTSTDYRKTFFDKNPQTKGKVVVHHAVEQQAMKRYPGVVSQSEMHSLENLRGIPKGSVNNRVHLSAIRKEWNRFYKQNPNPSKQDLLDHATKIDDKYGKQFNPPVR